jgi:hypothetical protein
VQRDQLRTLDSIVSAGLATALPAIGDCIKLTLVQGTTTIGAAPTKVTAASTRARYIFLSNQTGNSDAWAGDVATQDRPVPVTPSGWGREAVAGAYFDLSELYLRGTNGDDVDWEYWA